MRNTVLQEFRPKSRAARVLMVTAAGWAASGVFHIAVFAVDGGSLSGAVSWRKPIVFSVSIALTLWAAGWVLDRLPTSRPRLAGAIAWTFAVASTIETSLVVVQTWRGRASHFNVFAPADAALFSIMAAMVAVMSAALIVLFVWALIERPHDGATRWAVIAGLAAIVAGLGLGQWLIDLGLQYVQSFDAVPPVVMNGDAVAKFPHAVAFHGIQVFALLLALSSRPNSADSADSGNAGSADNDTARRVHAMRLAVAGYGGLLAFAVVQSVAGLAPIALQPWSLTLLTASGVALVRAFWLVFAANRSRSRSPVSLPT